MSDPYIGLSADPSVPGITGENTASGNGVFGSSQGNDGVLGITFTKEHAGVAGRNDHGGPGVVGISAQSNGVLGSSTSSTDAGVAGTNSGGGRGVFGESTGNEGVRGISHSPDHGAVVGTNDGGNVGVYGESSTFEGVRGIGHSKDHGAVVGTNDGDGDGVHGESTSNGRGVAGFSQSWQGVYGHSVSQAGVVGESDQFDGVFGISHNSQAAGISGHNPGGLAGFFDGNVVVTGDVTLTGADFAEEFDVTAATEVEPGTVMVLDQYGALQPSQQAYDKKVAGVISGAGDYKPGLILDRQQSSENRMPVALVGKVYCKVEAHYASIEVGDLLTTSDTPGHAMKADDPFKAFGSVIGKALRPLQAGRGLIPILIALQ